MSCCKKILGEKPHNEDIDCGVQASQNGVHKFRLKGPNFTQFVIKKTFSIGEDIVIPKLTLCEDFLYEFQIEQPDKTFAESDGCSTFTVQTIISTNRDCADYCCNV